MSQAERPVCALTIAGSDSGGGAGIQADLKTFAAHGVHGLSVITALTAQNTRGVRAVHVPDAPFLRAQLDAVFSDFRVGAVKLGMLANRGVIEVVAEALSQYAPPWVVLDPVMISTSGARLLDADALSLLRSLLVPRVGLLTPNLPEAELLIGSPIGDAAAAGEALDRLLALGPRAVLLKGGHMSSGDTVRDLYGDAELRRTFAHPRLQLEAHGTGCTLSAAIAAQLCLARSLPEACAAATDYVHGALRTASYPGGAPLAVLDHLWPLRRPL